MSSFPYPSQHHLARRVSTVPATKARRWVLRDDNGQHFHGTIPLSESQAYVELRWKPDARGREQVVGLFQLDLQRLLAEGYVRPEGDLDRPDPHVRLRFYRGDRGVVYVQPRSDAPSLAIGTVDLTL